MNWLTFWRRRPTEDADRYYVNALNHLLKSEDAEAQEWLTRTVRADSANVDAYLRLAEIFRRRGDAARALRIERELLVRGRLTREQRRDILHGLARTYEARKEWARAVETLRQLLEIEPHNVKHHRALVQALEWCGDWDAALEARRRSVKWEGEAGEKELAVVSAWVAARLHKQGKERDARHLLRESLRLDPHCPAALLLRGEWAEAQQRPEEAIAAWSQVARKKPRWADLAFQRLEQVYYDLGSFEKMTSLFADLLREDPHSVAARLRLAELLHRKGETDDARRLLREGIDLERREGETRRLRLLLVSILRETGNYREALSEIDRAGWLRPAPGRLYSCRSCRAHAKSFDWRCGECGAWGTMRGVTARAAEPSPELTL